MPLFSFLSKPRATEPAPRGPFDRTTPPTETDVRRRYERPSCFTNHLPWLDCDPEHRVFLLDGGRNVGALFEIRPAGVEARPEAWLAEFRDKIQWCSRVRSRSNNTPGSSSFSSTTSTGSTAWPRCATTAPTLRGPAGYSMTIRSRAGRGKAIDGKSTRACSGGAAPPNCSRDRMSWVRSAICRGWPNSSRRGVPGHSKWPMP